MDAPIRRFLHFLRIVSSQSESLGNAAQTGIQVNDARRFHEPRLGQLELPTGSRVGVYSVETAVDSGNGHGDQLLGQRS